MERIKCFSCNRKWPTFLFKKLPEGWYSRTGYNHSCKFCSFSNPIRYNKKKVGPFMKAIKRELTLWERVKEFFNV